MPKKLLATTIILALAITMLSAIPMSKANFIQVPGLYIQSPYNSKYSGTLSKSIPLWIEAGLPAGAPAIVSISYSLDGGVNITFPKLTHHYYYPTPCNVPMNPDIYFNRDVTLDNLTDGTHTVKAYSLDVNGNEMSALVVFTVSSYFDPNIYTKGIYPSTTPTVTMKPSETTETPTTNPLFASPTPSQGIDSNYWVNPIALIAIASMIVIIAVTSISLFYFKRRKGKQ
jgi:hypothetical protein